MEDAFKIAENEFISWLTSADAPSAVDEITCSYRAINTMLVKKKAITQPLVSITQIGQVENALRLSKKIFGSKKTRATAQKLLTAYLAFLREKKQFESAQSSVPEIYVQEDWIRFDFTNSDRFERTVPVYCLFKEHQIEGRNWVRILVGIVEDELEAKNTALEILYKQSLLSNRKDRPFFLKKKIDGLNCSELSNGYWLNVNYSIPRLMDLIQAFCLHCGYQKKDVTIFGVPRRSDSEASKRASTAKDTSNAVEINKAETFLKSVGLNGATVQELIAQVQPGAAVSSTRASLESSRSVISMPNGRYAHVDAFIDLDEAEEDMLNILQTHFKQFGGYSNNKLLFGAAIHDMSLFLNDNDCEDVDSVYSLAQYFFGKNTYHQFTFSFPHIFEDKPDFPLTLKGLMINFARKNGGLLNSESAKEYLQKTMLSYGSIGQLLQISSMNTFLYYDEWSKDYSSSKPKGIVKLIEYSPFCPYTVDLDFYKEARNSFSTEEWIDVLVAAADYNPDGYDSEEQKLCFLRRLLPFVEKRINLMELAPKGTGKSYVYQKISKRGWLISGGTVSRASLVYDNAKKTGGLITRFDFVGFDEIQSMSFVQPSQIQTALKDYMEFGEVQGFDASIVADAGIVVLGNIDASRFNVNENMMEEVSHVFRESASLDRFHGFIPGWKLPRMHQGLVANGWALNTEYFAEVLHLLRDDLTYATIVDDCLLLPSKADQRDLTAIKRLCTAFLKLIFPNATCREDIPADDFIKYCLEPAKTMRSVIKKQLCIIDPKEFNIPGKKDIPDIQYKY